MTIEEYERNEALARKQAKDRRTLYPASGIPFLLITTRNVM
jgi:uncharacterized protein YqhQ